MSANYLILVIDDEPNLRQTVARILQRAGYDVMTAPDGKTGLDLCAEHSFDLVYLDMRMPDMSGIEVLKALHKSHPDLPTILFTAQPDMNSAIEALRSGATDYLLKPINPETLITHTKAIFEIKKKERRKRELQREIDRLQAELVGLSLPENQEKKTASGKPDERYFTRGVLTLDLHTRRATFKSKAVDLPPTSFDYLLVLARHSPDVLDYQTLIVEAQGYQTDLREAQELVKWHIHHIRNALEPNAKKPSHLINMRGKGYRLILD